MIILSDVSMNIPARNKCSLLTYLLKKYIRRLVSHGLIFNYFKINKKNAQNFDSMVGFRHVSMVNSAAARNEVGDMKKSLDPKFFKLPASTKKEKRTIPGKRREAAHRWPTAASCRVGSVTSSPVIGPAPSRLQQGPVEMRNAEWRQPYYIRNGVAESWDLRRIKHGMRNKHLHFTS